ncbi:MAG: hypothetical protein H0X16_11235 [Chloroflexi bacterium]|nr:hypothetical protein [Chloroflexota bacterium]
MRFVAATRIGGLVLAFAVVVVIVGSLRLSAPRVSQISSPSTGPAFGAQPTPNVRQYVTSEQADRLGFSIDEDSSMRSAAVLSEGEAVAIARKVVRGIRDGTPAEIHHGRASQYENSPAVPVWIIVFPGGGGVPYGPAGEPPSDPTYSGAVVNDQTGEILNWFVVSEPHSS